MAAIFYSDLSGGKLKDAVASAPLGILPLGSMEYHGPHAAIGTDFFLAQELARRVGDALDALVLPTLPFAHCPPATRAYKGTLSVSEDTEARYLEDVLAAVFDVGLRGVLALNAHDGNIRPLCTAGDRLSDRFPDRFLLLASWWQALPTPSMEKLGFFSQGGGHGHGGPLEISAAGAIRPDTIDIPAARDIDVVEPPGHGLVTAIMEGRPPRSWKGYHGRATETSTETGARLLNMATEVIVARTREWLEELKPGAHQ